MVKLGTVATHFDAGQNYIVSLASLGFVLCLIVAVLGIKFRWFKQRLNFEQIPTGSSGSGDNGQVVLKRASRSSQEQFCEPVMVQGVFRQKLDEDVIIERPKTLPPIRIRKASRGTPSFGPPKRTAAPVAPVQEPVVIPPPPPPLPSSSSIVSLSQNGSTASFGKARVRIAPKDDGRVTFNTATAIITNGNADETYEELKTPEDQSFINYSERRPTGFVRPTEQMLEELKQLEREPPEIQPRTTTVDKARETFKKNPNKTAKITIEPLKGDDDDAEDRQKIQRRLTGFFPPPNGEIPDAEELFPDCSERKVHNKVAFHLDNDDDDEDDEGEEGEESNIPPTAPALLSTQLSTDEDPSTSDSWSAIQRHRNLAQEISEQHEAMQNRRREKAEMDAGTLVNQPQQPKPRTMRDMKRNNAKSDLLLDNDRRDFDA